MKPAQANDAGKVDGRVLRGERTRARIVDALIGLIRDGSLVPRAVDIAGRAGVSVRSVFQHFADFRELYLAAADRAVERVIPLQTDIPHDLPLLARIDRFIEQRVALCEAVAPLSRAAALYDPEGSSAQKRMDVGRTYSRRRIEQVFAPELDAMPGPERQQIIEAIMVAGDWETWDRLRRAEGLEPGAAERVMARLVRAVLQSQG
jgi:TetR/AcrR family transcriptional regulator of autoinduction and epiphytic fitness